MKKKRDQRFVIGSLAILGALGWLMATSMKTYSMRVVPVGELRAADASPRSFVGQRLRLAGFVARVPVRKTPQRTAAGTISVARFSVVDDEKHGANKGVLIEYRDSLPDTFRLGGPVQVDGVYTSAGTMRADHVFTKCPSRYEAEKGGGKGKAGGAKMDSNGVASGATAIPATSVTTDVAEPRTASAR